MKKEESGQALILVALMMAVLMGFAALVVDVGMMYSERTSLQAAADAAALAGAQDLPDQVKAVKSAVYIAGKNGILASETDNNTPYDSDSTKIEVRMERTLPLIFARFLGIDSAQISARAVAQNSKWAGDALPFINMDDNYISPGDKIEAWEPVAPGDKERIHDDVIEVPSSHSIKVTIKDDHDGAGPYILMKGGFAVGNEIPTPLTNIVVEGRSVYLFSLTNTLIDEDYADTITNINKYHIPMENLVLLKCTVETDWSNSEKTTYLIFEESYNWDPVKKTFLTPTGDIPGDTSRLVE